MALPSPHTSDQTPPIRFSFHPDDMPDLPVGPGEGFVWHEGQYVDLFNWLEHTVGDAQEPPEPPTVDDLPAADTPTEQHAWLERHGFTPDIGMTTYTHSTPCPFCDSSTHLLFASWHVGYAAASYYCQKQQRRVDWEPSADADPRPDPAGAAPEDDPDEDDAAPAAESNWTRVTSIGELKTLPRWIGTKNKKPLTYRPTSGTSTLKGSTFSHKPADLARCGAFEAGIDAETFVRRGGICVDHRSMRVLWDQKENRQRRQPHVEPRFESMGWADYATWQNFLAGRGGDYGISYASSYSDAPNIVVLDLDYPKPDKVEDTADATATRDAITERFTALGMPTCASASGEGRRAAFVVDDPSIYGGKHLIWRHHASGVNLEFTPPGCKRHVMLYGLDGDLPELDPAEVDGLLGELGFELDQPADNRGRYIIDGHGLGLKEFMAVVDRENWDLSFNTMSQTAFCGAEEFTDIWAHKIRSFLELNYFVKLPAKEGKGPSYMPFVVTKPSVIGWALETALLRHAFHPVQQWLDELPQWDGTARIDHLLQWLLGASVSGDDTGQLVRTASSDIVMGLVNRARQPGCAWPRITTLWGAQGIGKSAFLELLLPEGRGWYYESPTFPLTDEELFDNTRSAWLVEFSDPSTRRNESESAKTFVSRKAYQYRHRYASMSTAHPYNFGSVMTANPSGNTQIPVDGSGYRRYLACDCDPTQAIIKNYSQLKAWLDANRAQIWAEGASRYDAGERFAELPPALHDIRDMAAAEKTGNGALDKFLEGVGARLDNMGAGFGFPTDGLSMHDLVGDYLATTVVGLAQPPDSGKVAEFVNRHSVALGAGLKGLGLEQRKIGKRKLRRWFPAAGGAGSGGRGMSIPILEKNNKAT